MSTTARKPDEDEAWRRWLAAPAYYAVTFAPFAVTGGLLAAVEAWTGASIPILATLAVLFVLRQINVFVLSTLYHRSASHAQLEYHPTLEFVFRVWGWLFLGAGTRTWGAIHRWHHAEADGHDDPHSPTAGDGSLLNIGAQSIGVFWEAARHPEHVEDYTRGLPDDRLEAFIRREERRFFGVLGLRFPLLIAGSAAAFRFGAGLTAGTSLVAALAILPGLTGAVLSSTIYIINGLAHCVGYRRFETSDTSRNLLKKDLLGWGETLHHNHHARPGRVDLAVGSDEWDAGYAALKVLERMGAVELDES